MAENNEQLGKADNKGSYSEPKKFVATISSKSYILLFFFTHTRVHKHMDTKTDDIILFACVCG